jgi:hypothetical protein
MLPSKQLMKPSNRPRNWLAMLSLAIYASARADRPAGDYVEGEVLVRFHAAETLDSAKQMAARHGLTLVRHFGWLSEHEGIAHG